MSKERSSERALSTTGTKGRMLRCGSPIGGRDVASTAEAKATILVVDDNEMNRDLLSRRLRKAGYEALVAVDGPSALSMIDSEPIDLVLLDIRMPAMSGIEVLEIVRETRGKLDLPVVMVTAESDSAVTVQAIQLGANDYTTKPVNFPVVLARIESHLSMASEAAEQRGPSIVAATSDRLPAGFVIDGRYVIDVPVGHGSFAVVYRATQKSTGQTVAVKIMRADRILGAANAPTELARFERETKIIATIQHPNIVRLIDSGHLSVMRSGVTHDAPAQSLDTTRVVAPAEAQRITVALSEEALAVPYIVMEFLEGDTLKSKITRRGTLSQAETIQLMLPVISALGAAHKAGVVHRDATPANISLTSDPQGQLVPRVLDFGIAKLTGEGIADLTATASAIGTPNYMSPEQARGEAVLTPASDQYTIATIIYECLTGRCPHESESFISLLHMVASGEFPAPRTLNPDISDGLEAALLIAMAADPADRYDPIEAFGRALVPFASESVRAQWDPVFARPT